MSLAVILLLGFSACAMRQLWNPVSAFEKVAPVYPAGIDYSDLASLRANREKNSVSEEGKKGINQFSYNTAAQILNNVETNGCYSPLSLYFALSLASSGANGKTREELFALLNVSDPDQLFQQSGKLYRLLYTDNEFVKLKIANSLWLDNEYRGEPVLFKENFIQNTAAYFYSSLFSVDFAKESAGQAMAKWIADHTNNTLKPEFKPEPEQIMSIINTIDYRNEWIDRFDASLTKADTFHLANGADVTCDFMNMICFSRGFSIGDGYMLSSLDLKSHDRMVFVLPDEGVDLYSLLSSPSRLQDLFEGGTQAYGKVTWKIPKFACDSEFDLVDALNKLGITSAFKQDADFSGITDHQAFISSIIQNTHIAIDEKGVEASAFTKIDIFGSVQPVVQVDMILDRPFIYGIFSESGYLLFVGICGNPV